ncbi:response regulator [bacterium (Candidatus Gribaldobacteria) CG_4_10_14_0_2_um_filter_33_15]|nr:MAG: response regulator [bacterium (Candidatus Gribaldobacteria) CG_4_10_14_0_2_um_filter_33_15]
MSPKILIIEDDQRINKVYTAKLSIEGIEVSTALDGEEGLRRIYDEKPDLILLDLMLPKKSGFEILKEIKKDEKIKDIPVLILSNLAQEKEIEEGLALGAQDYLVKTNYSIQQVMERIKKALKGRN